MDPMMTIAATATMATDIAAAVIAMVFVTAVPTKGVTTIRAIRAIRGGGAGRADSGRRRLRPSVADIFAEIIEERPNNHIFYLYVSYLIPRQRLPTLIPAPPGGCTSNFARFGHIRLNFSQSLKFKRCNTRIGGVSMVRQSRKYFMPNK